ncbi:hypothetical protein [Methanobrevibacter sp. DSM 116169]|uniref:glycosyltransferase family 39 protein n=1 Tax=Methanobrevibacter sp. DSM 116169 TaxID=3242727 RepID=UPI0038FC6D68
MINIASIREKSNKEKIGILFCAIGLLYLFIMTYIGLTKFGLWYDEIFSLIMIELPFGASIDRAIIDVHPPLYYVIYKVFYKLFVFIGFSDVAIVGKIVSLTPFYLLVALAFTKIKKNFGLLVAGLFTLCITTMPQLMFYGVELRMYGWGLFFLTASFVYFYECIKSPNLKNWAILTILTICSAYTHYFSTIGAFLLYLLFLIYILFNNKSLIKNWLISSIIAVLSFIPWSFVLLNQFSTIHGDYWIYPITHETIIHYVYFVLSPNDIFIKNNQLLTPTILGTLFFIAILILLIKSFMDRKEMEDNDKFKYYFSFMGILSLILLISSGVIISLISSPIFHSRYMVPMLGCFWLGICILLSRFYSKKEIFIPIVALILIIGLVGTINFINIEENEHQETIETNKVLNNFFKGGDVILHDNTKFVEHSGFYIKNNHHLNWHLDIGENVKNALEDPGIRGEINSGSKVYFVTTKQPNYEDCINHGIKLKRVDVDFEKAQECYIYEVIID